MHFQLKGSVLAGLGLVLLAGCGEPPGAQNRDETTRSVRVARVSVLDSAREIRVSGFTRAGRRATLASLVSGTLVERPAELGQVVRAGELVARLSSPELKPAVSTADARVRELGIRLDQLERDVSRAEELRGRGLISEEDLERVRTERDATLALRDLALASLAEARNRLAEATLTAPFDATVDETLFEPGEFVAAGQPIIRLSGVGDLEVELEIPETLIDRFAPGQDVTLTLFFLGNREVRGRVIHVGDSGGAPGGLFPVEIGLADEPGLRPGLTVELVLPVEAEAGLAVPLAAILDPGTAQPRVFRIDEGRVEPVFVEVGQLYGNRVAVTGPLSPGDEVVVTGLSSLTPGQRVEVLR
jgi:RND family efflux transporter MFP subunit